MLSVDILGTKYRIEICGKNDSELQADSDGYCISARHLIGIRNFEDDEDWADEDWGDDEWDDDDPID